MKKIHHLYNRCIPVRLLMAIMMFTACWTSYTCRLQMPILAVPMIAVSSTVDSLNNKTQGVCDRRAKRSLITTYDLETDLLLENLGYNDQIIAEYQDKNSRRVRELMRESNNDPSSRQNSLNDDFHSQHLRQGFQLFSNKPFDWDSDVRGRLISFYAIGNVPGNFIGGWLAMRYGPRQSILWSSLIAATVSLISPLLAHTHWGLLAGSRVMVGLAGGITFPACHTMVAKWAPPAERSRFVWSLLGGTFGTIFTYPMVAFVAEKINWESGWYIPSIIMLVWTIVWALIAYDSPAEHPGITEEEKTFILNSQGDTVKKEKPTWSQTPLLSIMTSIPFLSLIVCHFGNLFLLFFYQNSMMLYLTKALGFKLTKGGLLASLPWAGRMLFGFFFSWIADAVKRNEWISLTALRKGATVFSHFIPGVFLILVGYVECNFTLANTFLFFALGFNGAASIANLSNNQDLSPNFAGFLYGIMNTIGATSGYIVPTLVEYITGNQQDAIDRWQIVFWVGAAVCIASMVVFIVGGSAQTQKWNDVKQTSPTAA